MHRDGHRQMSGWSEMQGRTVAAGAGNGAGRVWGGGCEHGDGSAYAMTLGGWGQIRGKMRDKRRKIVLRDADHEWTINVIGFLPSAWVFGLRGLVEAELWHGERLQGGAV